ncbi:unnamed protein product [Parajaminaea phylloscopi]
MGGGAPPDYSSQSYWQERFSLGSITAGAEAAPNPGQTAGAGSAAKSRTGEAFEWLGDGQELLLRLVELLEDGNGNDGLQATDLSSGGLALHIGSGSSDVGCRMRRLWETKGWDSRSIVNLDYAPSAIDLSRDVELREFGDVTTQHVIADLLDPASFPSVLGKVVCRGNGSDNCLVSVVFDKSTADAISTGESISGAIYTQEVPEDNRRVSQEVPRTPGASPPEVDAPDRTVPTTQRHNGGRRLLNPVEALCYQLAAASRPGALWAVQSYSASRFDFLESKDSDNGSSSKPHSPSSFADLDQLWKVTQKWPIIAPSGSNDVHAPEVFHWCYILERT